VIVDPGVDVRATREVLDVTLFAEDFADEGLDFGGG
jgi:hypothetical protein